MAFSKIFRAALVTCTVVGGLSAGTTAFAESLKEALSSAYHSNPTLRADRARLRATDELVPQALSGWRPTITAQGNVDHLWTNSQPGNNGASLNQSDININLNQPIFRGFKTVEGTAVAEANVRAVRQQLLSTEQSVLFNGVQAYMNVVRDRQIVSLRKRNLGFLQKQLDASTARFNAGELTRTDVAQSRASLSGSRASLSVAVANLQASEANYLTIVGRRPGKLATPALAKRPRSLDTALGIAQETNPQILAAAQIEDAATHNVEVIKGDLLPSLNLTGRLDHSTNPSAFTNTVDSASIGGSFVIPIYEAGRVYSGVRQAKQTASQNRIQVIGAVRAVREGVTIAWNNVIAAAQSLVSVRDQLSATNLALSGVQQEFQVGSRTTIDVLNAQQLVLTSQITEVSAVRDQVVASYQLLSAMGRLTAENLGIGNIYDPTENYRVVRDKWIGLSVETVE